MKLFAALLLALCLTNGSFAAYKPANAQTTGTSTGWEPQKMPTAFQKAMARVIKVMAQIMTGTIFLPVPKKSTEHEPKTAEG